MNLTTQLDDLQGLGRILQERLQSEFQDIVPFQVRCLLKESTLRVLAQHPADVAPDAQKTFSLLEQTLQEQQLEATLPVRLYLRVQGSQQPYTFHTFTVEPFVASTETNVNVAVEEIPNEEEVANVEVKQNPFNWADITETESIWLEDVEKLQATSGQKHSSSEEAFEEDEDEDEDDDVENYIVPSTNSWEQRFSEPEVDLDELFVASDNPDSVEEHPVSSHGWRPLVPVMLAGTGISLVVFFSSFYALTRPCVVSSCREIPIAQQWSYKSAQTLDQSQSGNDILLAKQELGKAIGILKSIPFWSSEHKAAQELLKNYQSEDSTLDQVINGLNQAATASQKSQNLPHSAAEWAEVQKLWQGAIATLQQVPYTSPVHQVARQKLQAYKVNLASIDRQVREEQHAAKLLQEAKQIADIASARQGVAQSVENWQLAQGTWQTSINRLLQIPQTTTAYAEAQQMLKSYQPQLTATRDRFLQEQLASITYKQSLHVADQAKSFQTANQWSQALDNWRTASLYLKRIAKGTFYYSKAQPLMASYQNLIEQAQSRLELATLMQKASKDLNQTCSGVPQICSYTITSDVIKVRMTPAYAQRVKQTAISAKARGDYNAQIGVFNHVLTVGEALEAISDNAHLRLEVYSPDGAPIQTHTPS